MVAYVNKEIIPFVEEGVIYTVLCSVLVFCFFNFRKKAKCFAGDVGSVSIAFIILFLMGRLIIKRRIPVGLFCCVFMVLTVF